MYNRCPLPAILVVGDAEIEFDLEVNYFPGEDDRPTIETVTLNGELLQLEPQQEQQLNDVLIDHLGEV